MEKDLKIKLDAKHSVYGRFEGSLDKPLFIVVHGLPCSMYEGLYEQATKWFVKHGYATFRFNMYSWQKDSRQLIDSTLRSHADDLDAIVRYFRKRGVKKIYVAGHSFGGPTILLSRDQDIDAAVLWDPSYDISFAKMKYGYPGGEFVRSLNGYFMRWGANVIIGKAMADEVDHLKWDELTAQFHVPLKIFAAGNGILIQGTKRYIKKANAPKSLAIIKGATHYFDDRPGMREKVYKMSMQWFKKF